MYKKKILILFENIIPIYIGLINTIECSNLIREGTTIK